MKVERIADGLWRWTALHPDWKPGEDWDEEVSSYHVEAAGDVVLLDPLVPRERDDRRRFLEALDRDVGRSGPPAIVLTVFWHERSAAELLARYDGATLWAHGPSLDRLTAPATNVFAVGDELPGGMSAFEADRRDEVVLWIPAHRALAAGDVLLGDDAGGVRLCPDGWLPDDVDAGELRVRLRLLLDLPVERILPGHGRPVSEDAHAKLAAALA